MPRLSTFAIAMRGLRGNVDHVARAQLLLFAALYRPTADFVRGCGFASGDRAPDHQCRFAALHDEQVRLGFVQFALAAALPMRHPPRWVEALPEGPIEFISTDFGPFRAALAATRFAGSPLNGAPRALAGAIARIAVEKFRRGLAVAPADVDANYVRRSDAELFWKS